jgi:hypothetical protein
MSISKTANVEGAQENVETTMDLPDTKPMSKDAESSAETATGEESLKQESSLAEADVSTKKLCGVCNEKDWRYKCSRCYLPT